MWIVENSVDNVDFSTVLNRKSSKIRLFDVDKSVDKVEKSVS